MTTTRETLAQTISLDFEDELRNTRKLLERVPLDDQHRGFRPHPKSMPLDRLASHVAELPMFPKLALEAEVFELQPDFKPNIAENSAGLLALFDESAEAGRQALAAASDDDMEKTWVFKFRNFSTPPELRTKVVRSFINHMIHHRAQLGVYLRLNGIAIPGMYGPSADEHF